jgi:BTB/POZ domain
MLTSCALVHTESLYELARKANGAQPVDEKADAPNPVFLGEQYVNSQTLSDVTFLVEGRNFYAHRIALLASSDMFKAMFDGHYREKEASVIPIPNIRHKVFEAMMRCIYTGEQPAAPRIQLFFKLMVFFSCLFCELSVERVEGGWRSGGNSASAVAWLCEGRRRAGGCAGVCGVH